MTAERCRPVTVEVDGEQIAMRVRGEEPMSDEARAAFAEIVAAAKRKFDSEPRRTDLCPDCGFPVGTAAHRRSRKHAAPDPGGLSAAGPNTDQPGG